MLFLYTVQRLFFALGAKNQITQIHTQALHLPYRCLIGVVNLPYRRLIETFCRKIEKFANKTQTFAKKRGIYCVIMFFKKQPEKQCVGGVKPCLFSPMKKDNFIAECLLL